MEFTTIVLLRGGQRLRANRVTHDAEFRPNFSGKVLVNRIAAEVGTSLHLPDLRTNQALLSRCPLHVRLVEGVEP